MKNRYLFILIFFLSLVATVLTVWRVFLAPKTPSLPTSPGPTSTSLPGPTLVPQGLGEPGIQEKIEKEVRQEYPLLYFIPHQTANWEVDYLAPLHLRVILQKDTPETRQEVLDWIESKGVNPTIHKIEWRLKS